MGLVGYPDSEDTDSDLEPRKPKIKVTLKSTVDLSNDAGGSEHTDAPPLKKPRLGGFSDFNAMLPPPKSTGRALPKVLPQTKEFETGKRADKEEREEDALNGADNVTQTYGSRLDDDKDSLAHTGLKEPRDGKGEEKKKSASKMIFKPLSVTNRQKQQRRAKAVVASQTAELNGTESKPVAPQKAPKVPLFSFSQPSIPDEDSPDQGRDYEFDVTYPPDEPDSTENYGGSESAPYQNETMATPAPTSSGYGTLSSIAADLNLSEAERRQLFGRRRGAREGYDLEQSKVKIVTFNTDKEYAANEVLRADGESVQPHNPLRAIAPGKHSLKQLVNAASSQKEALEDHFATSKRNRKEFGSRYGW